MTGPTRRRAGVIALLGVLLALALLSVACVTASRAVSVSGTTPPGPTEPTTTTTTSTPGHGPTSTTPPPLGDRRLTTWKDCRDGLQCATLRVPLDWSKPGGATISLAVIRKPATGPDRRIGSVLFNPGGPGEPGTTFLRDLLGADRMPNGLDQRFDVVSWDPRGTGDSAGVACQTADQLAAPDPDPTIDSPADVQAVRAEAARLLAGCKARASAQLSFVGTRNTVRDLDALRAALGDRKLTYVGYSYGTTIGQVYAEMYPAKIRAMVLDGVTTIGRDPVVDTYEQARSFEKTFGAFLDDCASSAACPFGNGNPRAAFTALVAKLESGTRLPADYTLPDPGGTPLQRRGTAGIGELYTAVAVTLYARDQWTTLQQALAAAANGQGNLLLYLRDLYEGRQEDGSWNHLLDANSAISCADQSLRPPDADGDDSLRTTWGKELPLLGAVFATGTPGCFGFPAAREPLTPVRSGSIRGVAPIVVVGATGDPATPYAQAVALQKLIPASVLVTWESADHTAYGRGSSCLDDPLTTYLEALTPPPAGLRCKP